MKWAHAACRLTLGMYCAIALAGVGLAQTAAGTGPLDLPAGKQLSASLPGAAQKSNSLPMTMTVSPDGNFIATLNGGFGTFESQYDQSIAVLNTKTGELTDFPEPRTASGMPQMLYQGLAFSGDGRHLYASFDSLTAPEGGKANQTGNAIAVYRFEQGRVAPERLIPIPLQRLAPGDRQNAVGAAVPAGMAIPSPAGIAVVPARQGTAAAGKQMLLVADNLSDDALLIDPETGQVRTRFDLSSGSMVPTTYPIAVTASPDGTRGFVALWNASAVAELDLVGGTVLRRVSLMPPDQITSPGSHPTAFAWSPDAKTLYVALANRDAVAALDVGGKSLRTLGYFDTRLPGQTYFGAEPNALAVSPDGKRLFAANAGTDSIAVFDTLDRHRSRPNARPVPATKPVPAMGFIPTEWLPTGVTALGAKLYIATGKGRGTGPNNMPQRRVSGNTRQHGSSTYIATLLYGSLAAIDANISGPQLAAWTRQVVVANMQTAAQTHIAFRGGSNPIKHVIYIIKENRTYDQVFGDLGVGDGDPSLTMYGRSITPNQHKLAEQFGVLDNFYDSGEVSGDGHVWSNAAISSDYTEKTWQQSYRGKQRNYDYEGVVENGFPLSEKIPDVNEPESSYLWTDLARHGKSLYHFGEYVATRFCGEKKSAARARPQLGTPEPESEHCATPSIKLGDTIPANYGGGKSPYPWPIPLIAEDIATKPELVGHFDPRYPDFQLDFPDQLRVEEFLTHFRTWVATRVAQKKSGTDPMPAFVMLRLPNDHTAGAHAGMPRPKASVADNDLAVGRAVEAVSHSPYWEDTAFFILEDDAQNGADHVDAHRSTALVISKYAPRQNAPLIDHRFYTTVSMLRTMEDLLDIPPMNNNDAFAPPIAPLFAGAGDQPPFTADYSNRDNGLIYQMNPAHGDGAEESNKMDFRHEDRADPQKLNVILWRDAMGAQPLPAALRAPSVHHKDDDD